MKLVQIQDNTHQALKELAVSSGTPLKDLAEKILSEYLKKKGVSK